MQKDYNTAASSFYWKARHLE